MIERKNVIQLERTDLGTVLGVRSPVRFQNCTVDQGRAPPALGDSTEAVLTEIGLSEMEIESLLSDGVVAKPNRI